jgi:hypothetical protein
LSKISLRFVYPLYLPLKTGGGSTNNDFLREKNSKTSTIYPLPEIREGWGGYYSINLNSL